MEKDFGFDVSVKSTSQMTYVCLSQDDSEACCYFLSQAHLEGVIDALMRARDWCRQHAGPDFKEYVPDRYKDQILARETAEGKVGSGVF